MRKIVTSASALLLACFAAPISAQGPADPVELRIAASGVSVNRADSVTIYVPVVAKGETAAAAKAANRKLVDDLTGKLVAKGFERSMISLVPEQTRFGFIGNAMFDAETEQPPIPLAPPAPSKTAMSTVRVKFRDPALTTLVREVLHEANLAMGTVPLLALQDARKAKDAAIADALANARREADAYAARLGMKVARIKAVSNFSQATYGSPDYVLSMLTDTQEGDPDDVKTRANVSVDFELTPQSP